MSPTCEVADNVKQRAQNENGCQVSTDDLKNSRSPGSNLQVQSCSMELFSLFTNLSARVRVGIRKPREDPMAHCHYHLHNFFLFRLDASIPFETNNNPPPSISPNFLDDSNAMGSLLNFCYMSGYHSGNYVGFRQNKNEGSCLHQH